MTPVEGTNDSNAQQKEATRFKAKLPANKKLTNAQHFGSLSSGSYAN